MLGLMVRCGAVAHLLPQQLHQPAAIQLLTQEPMNGCSIEAGPLHCTDLLLQRLYQPAAPNCYSNH